MVKIEFVIAYPSSLLVGVVNVDVVDTHARLYVHCTCTITAYFVKTSNKCSTLILCNITILNHISFNNFRNKMSMFKSWKIKLNLTKMSRLAHRSHNKKLKYYRGRKTNKIKKY